MSHELDQAEDGRTAFMVADGLPAWHTLGQMKGTPATAAEALELSYTGGWDVHKVPIYGQRGDKGGMAGRTISFPDKFGVVRTSPFSGELEGLGVVGKLWTPVQNEELIDFMQGIVDESGAVIHTAGAIEGGRKVFYAMKMPESVLIGGEDAIDLYLIATNAHDGSGSLGCMVSPVRPVCKNTLDAAVRSAKRKWSMRHTTNVEGKMQEAREALAMTWKYQDKMQEEFELLLSSPMPDDEFDKFLKELMPDPKTDKEGWLARAEGQRSAVMNLFRNADTCEFGRGTKWAAYNAVTEYVDWYRPGSPERRAREALGIGVNQHYKPDAYKELITAARRSK